jgi:hypothetical protein
MLNNKKLSKQRMNPSKMLKKKTKKATKTLQKSSPYWNNLAKEILQWVGQCLNGLKECLTDSHPNQIQ